MGKCVRAVAALVGCLLILAACGFGPGTHGLPDRPRDRGGPEPTGHIAYQMPFLPIIFSVDANGKITIGLNRKLATPLGDVIVGGNDVIKPDGKLLRPEPADITQLVICHKSDAGQRCEAYQIGTGRKIKIEMNGNFVQTIERNKIIIDAAPGATIKLTDSGPPAKLEAFGPARIDVEEFRFREAGDETEVDLERSRSGTATDLSYDHISGEIKPIHGAKISLYSTWGRWSSPSKRSDYPGEQECLQKSPADWRDTFRVDDLNANHSIFCVKTVEGDLGFLFIEPDSTQKPVAYYVYALTWVR